MYIGNSAGDSYLVLTNGATLTGQGAVVGQNTGSNGQIIIDGSTMTQNGSVYFGGFGSDRGGAITLVNGSTLSINDIFMPWSQTTGAGYGGPGTISVTDSTLAFNSIKHGTNQTGQSSAALLVLDNAVVRSKSSNTPYIESGVVIRVRDGGATFDLTSAQTLHVRSALIGDPDSPGGGLTKQGAGTLILLEDSTYTGPTVIEAGRLQVGAGGAAGTLGAGTVTNDGTLWFNRTGAYGVGAISGSGSLHVMGSGTLTLNGANTFSGGLFVTNSAVRLASGGDNWLPNGQSVTLTTLGAAGFSRLDLGGFTDTVGTMTMSGLGTKTIDDDTWTGAGTLIVTNQFLATTGTTVVQRVTVQQTRTQSPWSSLEIQNATLIVKDGAAWTANGATLGADNAMGHLIIDSATMTQNGGIYFGGFSSIRTGMVSVVNGGVLDVGTLFMPWGQPAGTLYGGTSILNVKDSTVSFDSITHQTNQDGISSTATVLLDNAMLQTRNVDNSVIQTGVTVRVAAGGARFDVAAGRSMTLESGLLADPDSPGGGIRKTGDGTLVLREDSAYTGTTVIEAGTLQVGNGDATGTLGAGGDHR